MQAACGVPHPRAAMATYLRGRAPRKGGRGPELEDPEVLT